MINWVYKCAKQITDRFKKKDKAIEFLDKLYKMRKEIDTDITIEQFASEFVTAIIYKNKKKGVKQ